MSIDYIVAWKKDHPSTKDVITVLTDYLGGAGKIEKHSDYYSYGQFSIILTGINTNPFKTLVGVEGPRSGGERWFELITDQGGITVITRTQDEFTNNIAKGFADLCARYWQGRKKYP